ncbi:hypothetical protein [Streptomyces adelaidensis]|uniref:hypothetical protein n=1 Tax=Streptomyces adelaidensis TaxID=2796465 RepID=UPI00190758E8|nr:hypothetical protein [Streptomyces adelaidensis]
MSRWTTPPEALDANTAPHRWIERLVGVPSAGDAVGAIATNAPAEAALTGHRARPTSKHL